MILRNTEHITGRWWLFKTTQWISLYLAMIRDKLLHQFILFHTGPITLTLHAAQIKLYTCLYIWVCVHACILLCAQGQPIKFQDWWYCISMISHTHSQFLLVHIMTARDEWKESCRSISASVAFPCVRCIFVCHGTAQANIKFLLKLRKTAIETHKMLWTVYGNEALSQTCVFQWFNRCRLQCVDHEDDPRNGWLSTTWSLGTIVKFMKRWPQTIKSP